jgi:hypothetical protein
VPQQQNDGTYEDGAAQQPPQRDRDTMAEVQEQFSKLAESKLTYSSFHPSNFFLPPSYPNPTTPPPPFPSFLIPVATYRRQRPGSTAITWWLRESPLLLLCNTRLP